MEGTAGEAFNIGFGGRISINQLAEKLIVMTGNKDIVVPKHDTESRGDFPETQADNGKARRVLGWSPRVALDQGLKDYVEWFKANFKAGGAA